MFKPISSLPVLVLLPFYLLSTSPLRVDRMSCEYLENPLGIDVAKPRFAWTLTSEARNQFQLAYEILVSDQAGSLDQGRGNLWSSGIVRDSNNIQIEYGGSLLKPFTRYYWKIRVYNQEEEASEWSRVAWFETAMLSPADWKSSWINDGSVPPDNEESYYEDDPMPLFRKKFNTGNAISSARLYLSGLGYGEAELNGRKIGDQVLDPGFTTYRKQVYYVVHDITRLIEEGNNTLGIRLGNGWWNPLPLRMFGRWDLRAFQQSGRPCLRAEIHLTYKNGQKEIIPSDPSWETAPGPVLFNNVYLGEKYDARLEKSFDDSAGWKNASLTEGPDGILTSQMLPPIRITKEIRPVQIRPAGKDTFIVDMGQNFAGVARIRVQGPAGTKISMRFGEDTMKDGRLNWWTTVAGQIKEAWGISGGPGAPKTAWQKDEYILKGEGVETWAPQFTFHGFRYVEITGWPGQLTIDNITGLRMNSDLPSNGRFQCSNTMFNRLHEAIQWTFLSNVFSVQSDCPAREKMGYGADIVVSSEAFLYNYDMAHFYTKSVRDFANEQRPEGGITEIAPFTGIADRGYGDQSGPLGWQLGFPFLQKKLYEFYGDKRILEQNYAAFERQMNFLKTKAVSNLFHWDISDHEALDPKPEAFSAAAFYYHHALLMAEISSILGKSENEALYGKLAHTIKNLIVSKYHIPGTGRFDNATQSAQLFALWYRFAPDRAATFQALVQEFKRHNMHLSTGIFSTKFLFDVLREEGQAELAYLLANQRDYPGWGYMLDQGATTLWETWAYPDRAPSQNHPMFGSIDEWFYRSILGINPAAPGFAKVILKPQPAGDLTWARGSYQSIRGTISSDWKIEGNKYSLKINIPANVKTEVWIRCKEKGRVTENGIVLTGLRYEKGYAVVELGSGEYLFESEL